MNKSYQFFILLLLWLPALPAFAQADAVRRTVNDHMAAMLANIPEGQEAAYGFGSRAEFSSCVSGQPIRVLTVMADSGLPVLTALNEWRVPVTLHGRNLTLLTVVQKDGHYEIADLGGALLSRELESKAPQGAYAYMVRLFDLHADFISASDSPEPTNSLSFVPLYSASLFIANSGKITPKASYTVNDLATLVQH